MIPTFSLPMTEQHPFVITEPVVRLVHHLTDPTPNSFNWQYALELQAALDRAANEANIARLHDGNGKAFCAGQDLSGDRALTDRGSSIVREALQSGDPDDRNLEKPVICAVNGVAASAGANIKVGMRHRDHGKSSAPFISGVQQDRLVPDSGGVHLPRLIGWQRASALMMTGDKVRARRPGDGHGVQHAKTKR